MSEITISNISKWYGTQRQLGLNQNPDNKESIQTDIDYTKGKISELNKKISVLKTEISTLEKNARDKLSIMKNDLLNSKKKIDYFTKFDNNKN
jgi:septal ring factor EnvC (AmiA/AmiB activator)